MTEPEENINTVSIELKANSEGLVLDVFGHTKNNWYQLNTHARTWGEMNIERPDDIDDNTGVLYSELFDTEEIET